MRSRFTVLFVFALILSACGGGGGESDESDDNTTQSVDESQSSGDGQADTGMDPNFDIGDVPDDVPQELIPDSFNGGFYAELGEVRSLNFETSKSFDEMVEEYTGKLGDPMAVVEAEERLASWIVDDVWTVGVLDTNPTTIAIGTAG